MGRLEVAEVRRRLLLAKNINYELVDACEVRLARLDRGNAMCEGGEVNSGEIE